MLTSMEYFYFPKKDLVFSKYILDYNERIHFTVFDSSREVSPEYQIEKNSISSFKYLGGYEFDVNKDQQLFKDFLKGLNRKGIITHYNDARDTHQKEVNFFFSLKSIDKSFTDNISSENLLKLHVSSTGIVARGKQKEFIDNLAKDSFSSTGNKVYVDNWVHVFLGMDTPKYFHGFSINEAEFDTSAINHLNQNDEHIKNSIYAIQEGLKTARL